MSFWGCSWCKDGKDETSHPRTANRSTTQPADSARNPMPNRALPIQAIRIQVSLGGPSSCVISIHTWLGVWDSPRTMAWTPGRCPNGRKGNQALNKHVCLLLSIELKVFPNSNLCGVHRDSWSQELLRLVDDCRGFAIQCFIKGRYRYVMYNYVCIYITSHLNLEMYVYL